MCTRVLFGTVVRCAFGTVVRTVLGIVEKRAMLVIKWSFVVAWILAIGVCACACVHVSGAVRAVRCAAERSRLYHMPGR